MKFQLKALSAALALLVALPASAAIDKAVTGNGSVVLTLLDRVGTISATFDLGKNYSDFSVSPNVAGNTSVNGGFLPTGIDAEGVSLSWNLTQGDYAAAWTSFLSVGTLANTKWGVIAGDVTGSGAGGRGYITTAAPGAGSPISSSSVSTVVGSFDVYLTQANAEGNHPTVANGGSTAIAGQGYAGSAVIAADGSLFGKGPFSMNTIGSDSRVIQLSSTTSTGQANQYTFANNAKFNLSSAGLLTYSTNPIAAVPEANTWAMMLLGLGMMGFIARRKQS